MFTRAVRCKPRLRAVIETPKSFSSKLMSRSTNTPPTTLG